MDIGAVTYWTYNLFSCTLITWYNTDKSIVWFKLVLLQSQFRHQCIDLCVQPKELVIFTTLYGGVFPQWPSIVSQIFIAKHGAYDVGRGSKQSPSLSVLWWSHWKLHIQRLNCSHSIPVHVYMYAFSRRFSQSNSSFIQLDNNVQ